MLGITRILIEMGDKVNMKTKQNINGQNKIFKTYKIKMEIISKFLGLKVYFSLN